MDMLYIVDLICVYVSTVSLLGPAHLDLAKTRDN